MKLKFISTIAFVKDINKSKKFYTEILGLTIVKDFHTIVFFENQFVIHDSKNLIKTIFKKKYYNSFFKQGRKNLLICFEYADINEIFNKVKLSGAKIIHKVEKQAWGQNVFRFYDYDNHIVEIGEPFEV